MTNAGTELLDAAERLLAEEGRAALTTRRIARAAGLNHGLVHYHFGSVDALVEALAERFTAGLTARRQAAYAGEAPFLERWRAATSAVEHDLASGRARVWAELQAMAFDNARLRPHLTAAALQWRAVLAQAFAGAARELGLTPAAVDPLVTLVVTFTGGMTAERLAGVEDGHRALLEWCDAMLVALAEQAGAPD